MVSDPIYLQLHTQFKPSLFLLTHAPNFMGVKWRLGGYGAGEIGKPHELDVVGCYRYLPPAPIDNFPRHTTCESASQNNRSLRLPANLRETASAPQI